MFYIVERNQKLCARLEEEEDMPFQNTNKPPGRVRIHEVCLAIDLFLGIDPQIVPPKKTATLPHEGLVVLALVPLR